MQTRLALLYFIFPIITEGCCGEQSVWKLKDAKLISAIQRFHHYKAVEGEIFMIPCDPSLKSGMKWFKGNEGKACGEEFVAMVEDAGTYRNCAGSNLTLQVLVKSSLRCFQPSENSVMLLKNINGTIFCPGHECYNSAGAIWYKKEKPVSNQTRDSCQIKGQLHLCTVYEKDTGLYYCDRQIPEKGVTWIFRRPVNVTVIPQFEARSAPVFKHPAPNMTEAVELGQPHNLTCKVIFDFEVNLSRQVQWVMNYGGDMEKKTLLHLEHPQETQVLSKFQITQKSIIKEVTQQHLKHTYTCFASNTVGNNSVTIKLNKKTQVKWQSLVGYPFACFFMVICLGVILHVKWVEIQLLCRSRFQLGKCDGEKKEFDVFVSYVSTVPSAEVVKGLFSKPYSVAEGCISNMEMQSNEEPIEMLLPQVLEDQWGYRVCLLERDILPGGAYTNDVVLTINNSRMLICILSAEYFASGDAVFVLESGVKALLQRSALKMLLIWTSETSPTFSKPEPQLPKLVQKALKVLPSLEWSTDCSSTAIRSFWNSLRKAMPALGERQG